MVKHTALLIIFLMLPLVVKANSQLDRLEDISEEMSSLMFSAMIEAAEAEGADTSKLKTLVPDTRWDNKMRDAGKCILDKYEQRINSDGIDTMLDNIEAMIPEVRKGGMEALEKLGNSQPSGISDEEAIAINQDCGMIKLQQEQMMANNFMTELMKLSSEN